MTLANIEKKNMTLIREKVIAQCPFGETHFCNGAINKSAEKRAIYEREPCIYLRGGRCGKNIYKRA